MNAAESPIVRKESCFAARIDAAFPLEAFKARLLDENVAQVTYNSAVTCAGVVEVTGGR